MRRITAEAVTEAVKNLAVQANFELGGDVVQCLKGAAAQEDSPLGREILGQLLENAEIAQSERIPICQDTGLGVVFAEMGQEASVVGGDFESAVKAGIRSGYGEACLRKSVCHPFTRKNTGDNTPVIIHVRIVPGDKLKIWVVPKGGGSENMSRLFMLSPSAGWPGVKEKVIRTVEEAGPNPCPPTIVGVGIGGNFEMAALLAKKALLRPCGTPNPDPETAEMERELLEEINKTGVGPEGFGGRTTSLDVHVFMMPCHIASLPLAINIQCHASRHKETVI